MIANGIDDTCSSEDSKSQPGVNSKRQLRNVGDKVHCAGLHGIGVVRQIRVLRFEAEVQFGSVAVWRPFEDLRLVEFEIAGSDVTTGDNR
jgi:hypothetical protein